MACTQSSGLLNGTGTLTVSGLSTLSGGRESGSGTTIAQGGALFSTTNFSLDGGRTLQLGGASTATGTSGQINLNGADPSTGLSDTGSGNLTIASGATFNDQTTASGLTILTSSHGSGDTGATSVFNNFGTFTKSGSALTSTISATFNNTGTVGVPNSGTVNVQSGTLNLSGGGTDIGASYTGAGTIQFSGGTRTLDATSSINGNALFSGGTTTVNGGVGTGLMTVTGGTATFNGTVTTGALTQSSGLLNGTGILTISGLSTLSGGRESGSGTTIAQGGALFSTTNFSLDGGRTLQLGGASTATGTSVQINLNGADPSTGLSDTGSGNLTIASGATFNDQTTASGLTILTSSHGSGDTGATSVFNNFGTFTKSGSALTSTISTTFNNTGTVEVQTGTLDFSNAVTGTGAYTIGTVSNGATLEFDSSVAAGATVTFEGLTGTLLILQPSSFSTSNVISGISGTGDVLDLRGFSSGSDTVHATTGAGSFNGTNTTLTVTDVTHSATFQFTLQGDYSGSTWTVTSDGHGGFNIVDPPATFATIASGGSLELNAPSNETVSFAGGTGSLVLNQPEGFTGQIVGFTGTAPDPAHSDTIDLVGIDYNSSHFAESYSASTGLLTVTDGNHTASLTFVDFNATLDFSSDGNGGTLITDPPSTESAAPSVLTSAASDRVSGSITFAAGNSAGAETASVTPDGSNYLGRFSLGRVTEKDGVASVEFNFNDDQVNLAPGQTLTQSYNVGIADPQNPAGTMNRTVSVSIGGSGSDNFVFKPGIGADTVVNFNTQHDTIELDNFSSAQTVQQLQALITTDIHDDAVIELGHGDSITLAGTTAQQLQAIVHGSVYLH